MSLIEKIDKESLATARGNYYGRERTLGQGEGERP